MWFIHHFLILRNMFLGNNIQFMLNWHKKPCEIRIRKWKNRKMYVKWLKFWIFRTMIFPGAFLFLWWRLKNFKPLLRLLSGILRMTHIFDQIGYLLLQFFIDCSSCFELCFFFHMQKILCIPFKRESIFTSWIKAIL